MWDGGTARQLGLVDGFGGMDEAIAKAAELAKLGDERGVCYLEAAAGLTEQVLAMLAGEEEADAPPADALAMLAPAPEALLLRGAGRVARRSSAGRRSRSAASNARRWQRPRA